jgi:hypothetical protein
MGMFGICGNHDEDPFEDDCGIHSMSRGDDYEDKEEYKIRPFSKERRTPDEPRNMFGPHWDEDEDD